MANAKNTPATRQVEKFLPKRVYPRGNQGTFIYAPDIAVYVMTDNYGVIDLTDFITTFNLQRNVNAPSTFMCSFDNKFSRYDRVIRRMDRIVVFLKRVEWVQAFAGYVSQAPWETVVPGDAQLMADCTLKRLVYTYWDPHSAEAQQLYPKADVSSATTTDSGSAATMFRLLTTIAKWPENQIQIQKIPEVWLAQAVSVLKKTEDDQLNDPDYQVILRDLKKLLGEEGDNWLGYKIGNTDQTIGDILGTADSVRTRSMGGGMGGLSGVDAKWRELVGGKNIPLFPSGFGTPLEYASGFVEESGQNLVSSGVQDTGGTPILLRRDAARSLRGLAEQENISGTIKEGYISYQDQKTAIQRRLRATKNDVEAACSSAACPAGSSEHGWATAIDFDQNASFIPDEQTMNDFGWINVADGDGGVSNPNHYVFVGNYTKGWPAYITNADKPRAHRGGHGPHPSDPSGSNYTNTEGQFDWDEWNAGGGDNNTANNVFKTTYFWPGIETQSQILTGKRAWINDVPLLESIADMASASLRDFQSAPNGDFIAFFPDRLGKYGKFPAMQVRDIEITDFKMIIQDRTLVTHYVSVADMTNPEPHTGTDLDVLINAGYVTVEQPEVMRLLLGLPEDQTPVGLGQWIMNRFGIRPRRDDNFDIWNPGFNYMIALHRFQEAWASQWNVIVGFTFLPELYPGMRIELVNYGLSVYVEQIAHSGSRTSGFTTIATVSTPMTKAKNGTWKLLPMEFDPAQFKTQDAFESENQATQAGYDPETGLTTLSTGHIIRGDLT